MPGPQMAPTAMALQPIFDKGRHPTMGDVFAAANAGLVHWMPLMVAIVVAAGRVFQDLGQASTSMWNDFQATCRRRAVDEWVHNCHDKKPTNPSNEALRRLRMRTGGATTKVRQKLQTIVNILVKRYLAAYYATYFLQRAKCFICEEMSAMYTSHLGTNQPAPRLESWNDKAFILHCQNPAHGGNFHKSNIADLCDDSGPPQQLIDRIACYKVAHSDHIQCTHKLGYTWSPHTFVPERYRVGAPVVEPSSESSSDFE